MNSSPCDLLILVSNRRYYIHSFLFFNICPSWEKFLVDNPSSSSVRYTCQLKFTSSQGFELLLVYIYTARIVLHVSTVSDLYLVACELDVKYLIEQSVEFLERSIENMYETDEEVRRMFVSLYEREWLW